MPAPGATGASGGHTEPAPEILVSLSMDLWAAREGFKRIEPGLAGELA